MAETIDFTATTSRLGLPLLFAAQAGKEVVHNEALARIDALLHPAIEGERSEPPASAADGTAWIVSADAVGDWMGRDGMIALRQLGQWLFVQPAPGMWVFDRELTQFAFFSDGWQKASTIQEPSGGSTVDSEARAAIGALLLALRASGILPSA